MVIMDLVKIENRTKSFSSCEQSILIKLMLSWVLVAFIWFQFVQIEDDFWQWFAASRNSMFDFKSRQLAGLNTDCKCPYVSGQIYFRCREKLLINMASICKNEAKNQGNLLRGNNIYK